MYKITKQGTEFYSILQIMLQYKSQDENKDPRDVFSTATEGCQITSCKKNVSDCRPNIFVTFRLFLSR